jgi:hypothetical protein
MWRHYRVERTQKEEALLAASAGFDRVRVQRFVDNPPTVTQEAFDTIVKGLAEHAERTEAERKRVVARMDSSIILTALGIFLITPFGFLAFLKVTTITLGCFWRWCKRERTVTPATDVLGPRM